MKKGQVTVAVAVVSAVGVLGASVLTAWATASSRIADIESKVDVVEEREDNHFQEVVRRLDTIEAKIDTINTTTQSNAIQ